MNSLLDPKRIERQNLIGLTAAHQNASPLQQPDRFLMGDRTAIRATYESTCAELMSEYFPSEHAQLESDWNDQAVPNWAQHVNTLDEWLAPYVNERTLPPGASPEGWA